MKHPWISEEEFAKLQEEIISFASTLIQIRSITGDEEEVARAVAKKMEMLQYDKVTIDDWGNVVGEIGDAEECILFDAHMDTVDVPKQEQWDHGPFSGERTSEAIYGRGAVDMKSALAAIVYVGYVVKKWKIAPGKKVVVSATVMEEDYDGLALDHVLRSMAKKPSYVIICEPSNLKIAVGHRGRSMLLVSSTGVSAHGSMPETGVNAIYRLAPVLPRVEEWQQSLSHKPGRKGSVALTRIESTSASLNAVPDFCCLYLDRRTVLGEDEAKIAEEMERLLQGLSASWQVEERKAITWSGADVHSHTFFPAWEMEREHALVQAAVRNHQRILGAEPEIITWDFSTNGVASCGIHHIPTIGLGPGDPSLAHRKNEHCLLSQIQDAFCWYVGLLMEL